MLHARQPSIQHIRLVASRVPERVPHNWPSSLRLLCTAAIICGQWDHLLSVSLSVHRLVCARVRVRSAYTAVAALGTMARNSRDLLVVLFEAPSSEIEDRGRSPSGHVAATRCKYSVATAARAARDQHARQPLVLGGLVRYPKAAETARRGCTSASCCELARLLRAVAARGQRPCYRARAAAATTRDQGGMYAEPFATGADRITPRAVWPSAHRVRLPLWADKHRRLAIAARAARPFLRSLYSHPMHLFRHQCGHHRAHACANSHRRCRPPRHAGLHI